MRGFRIVRPSGRVRWEAIHSSWLAICVQPPARAACPASGRMFSGRHVRYMSGATVCVGRSVNSLGLHRSLIGMAGDCAAFDVRWEGVDVLRHNACYRRVRCCLGGGTSALLSHLPSH